MARIVKVNVQPDTGRRGPSPLGQHYLLVPPGADIDDRPGSHDSAPTTAGGRLTEASEPSAVHLLPDTFPVVSCADVASYPCTKLIDCDSASFCWRLIRAFLPRASRPTIRA